jgi:N-acetylmuramoyl-L-alanine amidase
LRVGRRLSYCFAEYILFVLMLLLSIAFLVSLFFFLLKGQPSSPASITNGQASKAYHTVILDAGHGGEDGGAVGHVDGREVQEKNINLAITLTLRDMLEAEGINVILTREEDVLLYDRNTDYQGRKKVLDLAARLHVGQSTPGAVFVSIHMNAFTQPQYRGLQVYYSPNHPMSKTLADGIQTRTEEQLQPDNHRATKAAGSDIFLLDQLRCPAVLVECGFLSNEEECRMLQEEAYQQKIAFLLFCSIRQALIEEGETSVPLWSKIEFFAQEVLILDPKCFIMIQDANECLSETEDARDERNQNDIYLLGMRNEKPQVAGQMPLLRRLEFLC